jgi:hypothetical protein
MTQVTMGPHNMTPDMSSPQSTPSIPTLYASSPIGADPTAMVFTHGALNTPSMATTQETSQAELGNRKVAKVIYIHSFIQTHSHLHSQSFRHVEL